MKILTIQHRKGHFIVDVDEHYISSMALKKRRILKRFIVDLLTQDEPETEKADAFLNSDDTGSPTAAGVPDQHEQ